MNEIKNIVLAFDEATKSGKKTALATVVHVEGSSYRRPGARMLVDEDGKLTTDFLSPKSDNLFDIALDSASGKIES